MLATPPCKVLPDFHQACFHQRTLIPLSLSHIRTHAVVVVVAVLWSRPLHRLCGGVADLNMGFRFWIWAMFFRGWWLWSCGVEIFFSWFLYKGLQWGLGWFLYWFSVCCLAGIFFYFIFLFLGVFVGVPGDFNGGLQRDWWVLKERFFYAFL